MVISCLEICPTFTDVGFPNFEFFRVFSYAMPLKFPFDMSSLNIILRVPTAVAKLPKTTLIVRHALVVTQRVIIQNQDNL